MFLSFVSAVRGWHGDGSRQRAHRQEQTHERGTHRFCAKGNCQGNYFTVNLFKALLWKH